MIVEKKNIYPAPKRGSLWTEVETSNSQQQIINMVKLTKCKEAVHTSDVSDGFTDLSGYTASVYKLGISALYKEDWLELHTLKEGLCWIVLAKSD